MQKVTAGYTLRPGPLDIVADCEAVITALTARVHIAIDLLSYRTVGSQQGSVPSTGQSVRCELYLYAHRLLLKRAP